MNNMPINVKLWCAVMAAIIIGFFAGALLSGCTAIKQRSIANDLVDATNLVKVACDSVELFAAAGIETPGSDACESAMLVLDSREYATVYDAASCVKKHGAKTEEFLECVDKIDGWKLLAEKLSKTKSVDK